MIRHAVSATALAALLGLAACAPPPKPQVPYTPGTVTGTRFSGTTYQAESRDFVSLELVCTVRIDVDISLNLDVSATILANMHTLGRQPGCSFAGWLVSLSVECVPGCGKVYSPVGVLEQARSDLRFTRRPHLSYLRTTLTASYAGWQTGPKTFDSWQIQCETLPGRACLFQDPSPN